MTATAILIETDAPFDAATDIATKALSYFTPPSQTGRLGLQFAIPNPADADTIVQALTERGYEAWVTWTGASQHLNTYRKSREQMPAAVRVASAAGLTQAQIARESGLSRQWVAQIAQ